MRVVEGSAFIAAPSGGMTLALLGADVIRFDQIGGGIDYRRWPVTAAGKSLYWHSLNKGKRSIAVDFRQPEGKELLTRLITAPGYDAGIFLTNFPARGWLADAELRARRSDLIYLNLTGDRHGGSALDYTVNSRVGLPYITGDASTNNGSAGSDASNESDESNETGDPVNNPFPAWDVIAGQQIALSLLAAERHRRIKGEGQFISLALADVALATMGHLGYLAEVEVNGAGRPALGNHVFGTFGHDFKCKDGRRVMLVGVSPNQWQALVNVTQAATQVAALEQQLQLDFSKREGDRFLARTQLLTIFQPWFAARDYSEVVQALEAGGACWGPYQTIAQLVQEDADCSEANPLFERMPQPGIGNLLTPSHPAFFSALEREPARPAPQLGQHTEEILAETLKLDAAEIADLHDRKIVASATI